MHRARREPIRNGSLERLSNHNLSGMKGIAAQKEENCEAKILFVTRSY